MPFGLVNTLAVFQAFINDALWDLLYWLVIIYINNIVIYSLSKKASEK